MDFKDGLFLATPISKQLEISFHDWREYSSQRFFAAQVYWFGNGPVSTTWQANSKTIATLDIYDPMEWI